jgi:hypothetical protein
MFSSLSIQLVKILIPFKLNIDYNSNSTFRLYIRGNIIFKKKRLNRMLDMTQR